MTDPADSVPTTEDESGHLWPNDGSAWSEHWHFDFYDAAGAIGGYVRIGHDPAAERVWYWACLVRADTDPEFALVVDHDVSFAPKGRLELRSEGVWADHICETPFEHWTIGLETYAVSLDDPADAYGRMYGTRVPVGFDLEWESTRRPTAPVGQPAHYEQSCTVHGEILVGAEAIDLAGFGHRHHSWGTPSWHQGSGWSFNGRLDDGATMAIAVGAGQLTSARYTTADGTDHPIDSHELHVVAESTATFPSQLGVLLGPLQLALTPIQWAPVAHETAAGPERIPRALCRITAADGRSGVGWIDAVRPSATWPDVSQLESGPT